MEKLTEFLYPRKFKYFPIGAQILTIVALFVFYTFYCYFEYKRSGSLFGYPLEISILFVPIYEEVLFRGIILVGLTKFYSPVKSLVISSLLFGVWHLKNIFFIPIPDLERQMLYAAFVFWPVVGYITLRTRSVWPGVILHFVNNIWAPISILIWQFISK